MTNERIENIECAKWLAERLDSIQRGEDDECESLADWLCDEALDITFEANLHGDVRAFSVLVTVGGPRVSVELLVSGGSAVWVKSFGVEGVCYPISDFVVDELWDSLCDMASSVTIRA